MKKLLPLILILFAATLFTSCSDPVINKKLEDEYLSILDQWVEAGGDPNKAQTDVVETCGKLVMISVGALEKITLSTINRDEFHFRVDVCLKMTVNRVHLQPEFEKKEVVIMICDESKDISLFNTLCRRSGLR